MNVDFLRELSACSEAVAWCETHPDAATAWRECRRGDWMLWYVEKRGVRLRDMVLAACAVARPVLRLARSTDATELAIATAEQWAHGDESVTPRDLNAAAADAAAAYHAAAAAAYAADAAADATASAAAYAAYAAESAADAAYHAAAAAAYAADASYADAREASLDAREASLAQSADTVRLFWPEAP